MVVAVLADERLKEEFLAKKPGSATEIIWADSLRSLGIIEAEAYFDLLFENDPERIFRLRGLLPMPVFVNSVTHTTSQIGAPFIRINAWPTMLAREITELAVSEFSQEAEVKDVFEQLGWPFQLVPDTTGMVTPRILAMIINEAWYALDEKVSTKENIDIAMKLGTNYPLGPFEWTEKIGIGRVKELLTELARTESRYTIAPGLLDQ